jgi:hypothetical protein
LSIKKAKATLTFFQNHPVKQHAIIFLSQAIIMLISVPYSVFSADPRVSVALQFLIILMSLISLVIFHQQKKYFKIQNGKKPQFFLVMGVVFQSLVTIIMVNNFLANTHTLNCFIFSIPFLIISLLCGFVWIWCFPNPSFKNFWPFVLYTIFVCVLYILGLSAQYLIQINNINTSLAILSTLSFISILFILAGILIILIKHMGNWFAGFLFAVFSIIGISSNFVITTESVNYASLLFFELAAYLFLPFLPGAVIIQQNTNKKIDNSINEEMLVSWLKIIDKPGNQIIAPDFLLAIQKTFSADLAILAGSAKVDDAPVIMAISGENQNKLNLQKTDTAVILFKSLFSEGKSEFFLNKEDAFPEELNSFLKTIGLEKPVNLLFYPVPKSGKLDKQFALLLVSKETAWNQKHLLYLQAAKSELSQVIQHILFKNQKVNATQNAFPGKNDKNSLNYQLDELSGSTKESDKQRIRRLESELKLALEEYDRVLKLLEEKNKNSSENWK